MELMFTMPKDISKRKSIYFYKENGALMVGVQDGESDKKLDIPIVVIDGDGKDGKRSLEAIKELADEALEVYYPSKIPKHTLKCTRKEIERVQKKLETLESSMQAQYDSVRAIGAKKIEDLTLYEILKYVFSEFDEGYIYQYVAMVKKDFAEGESKDDEDSR